MDRIDVLQRSIANNQSQAKMACCQVNLVSLMDACMLSCRATTNNGHRNSTLPEQSVHFFPRGTIAQTSYGGGLGVSPSASAPSNGGEFFPVEPLTQGGCQTASLVVQPSPKPYARTCFCSAVRTVSSDRQTDIHPTAILCIPHDLHSWRLLGAFCRCGLHLITIATTIAAAPELPAARSTTPYCTAFTAAAPEYQDLSA